MTDLGASLADLPILVINLDRSADRWTRTSMAMQARGLACQRFAASDGARLSETELAMHQEEQALKKLGILLRRGELGCFRSHLRAAQAILDMGAEVALVLEDDIDVPAVPLADLERVITWARGSGRGRFDLINLGTPMAKFAKPVLPLSGQNHLVQAFYFPVLTHALLWSREGAQRFLAEATIDVPVDLFLQAWLSGSGRGFACQKPLFEALTLESTIQTTENRSAAGGDPRTANGIQRRLRKFRWKAGNYLKAILGLSGWTI